MAVPRPGQARPVAPGQEPGDRTVPGAVPFVPLNSHPIRRKATFVLVAGTLIVGTFYVGNLDRTPRPARGPAGGTAVLNTPDAPPVASAASTGADPAADVAGIYAAQAATFDWRETSAHMAARLAPYVTPEQSARLAVATPAVGGTAQFRMAGTTDSVVFVRGTPTVRVYLAKVTVTRFRTAGKNSDAQARYGIRVVPVDGGWKVALAEPADLGLTPAVMAG